MNSTTIDKSMNGNMSLTDGIITIEEGGITFSDGSVLDSITDIPLLSGDNTFTGSNTFNNNIIAPTAPTLSTHLTKKSYVDDTITTSITNLKTANNTFSGNNTFSNVIIASTAPTLTTHLTNKSYVDTANTTSITNLKSANNTFSGVNTFTTNAIVASTVPTLNTHLTNKLYVDNADILKANIASPTLTGIVSLTNTTVSTTYNTGALLIAGGVGITGNITVKDKIRAGQPYKSVSAIPVYTAVATNANFTSSNTLTVSTAGAGYEYANGIYTITADSVNNTNNTVYKAFNNDANYYVSFYTQDVYTTYNIDTGITTVDEGRYYLLNGNSMTGDYTTVDSVATQGEWIQVKIPYNLKVQSIYLEGQNSSAYPNIKAYTIAGSNNGTTWSAIKTGTLTNTTSTTLDVSNNTIFYTYYRLIIKSIYRSVVAIDYPSAGFNYSIKIKKIFFTGDTEDLFSNVSLFNNKTLMVYGKTGIFGAVDIDGVVQLLNNSGSDGYGYGALQLTQGGLYAHEISYFNKELTINGLTTTKDINSSGNVIATGDIKADGLVRGDRCIFYNSGYIGGSLTVDYEATIAGNIKSYSAIKIPNNFAGSGYVSQGESALEGLYQGNGDGATSSLHNLKIKSWQGIGFVDSSTGSNPSQNASIFMNVRNGTLTTKISNIDQTLSVSGLSSLNGGATITGLLKSTNTQDNKKWVIWDNSANEIVADAVNFFGFGINGSTLRYQASMTTEYHRFYCGSTKNLEVGNGIVNVPVALSVSGTTSLTGGMGADFKMNNNIIYFRSDTNHYIKYSSGNWDGIQISGYYGGFFHSTASNTPCLRWNTNAIDIPLTVASTSTTTGALIVAGGVGIVGALNVGGIVKSPLFITTTYTANYCGSSTPAGTPQTITLPTYGMYQCVFGQNIPNVAAMAACQVITGGGGNCRIYNICTGGGYPYTFTPTGDFTFTVYQANLPWRDMSISYTRLG